MKLIEIENKKSIKERENKRKKEKCHVIQGEKIP